jgi:AraC-like DNA-binding protein
MQKRSFLSVIAEEHFRKLPDSLPIGFLNTDLRESSPASLHIHSFLEIGLCLVGSGIFVVCDKIIPFSAGDVVVLSPGMPHHANSSPGVKSRWIFFFFDPVRLLSNVCDRPEILSTAIMNNKNFPCVFRHRKFPEISSLVRKIVGLNEVKRKWFETEIKALLIQLFIEINQTTVDHREKPSLGNEKRDFSSIERISPALNHIANSYKNQCNVRSIARLCGLSVETLRRLFRKAMGRSPESHLQHIRIQTAAALLENSGKTIGEISILSGFQTLSCFNRQFRKLMDISPKEWRRKNS